METGNQVCPQCRFDNTADSKFCKECGTQLLQSRDVPSFTKTLEIPGEGLTIGATFAGRYQVIEELGIGGMGKVLKALDQKLHEEVALKLLRPEIAADQQALERFSSELRIARKIVHKNVGRVYELMEDRGIHFITMEYVRGQDLKGLIRQTGQLTIDKTVSLAKQICAGLAEAHRMGIVHRDLKPGNIMIDKDGNARIMDFGIARSVHAPGTTGEGVVVGTPDYMSPEQVEGQKVDHRSDIYSLGIILFEMVTGRVPFTGETPLSVAVKHKTEKPLPPAQLNPLVTEGFSRIILKCLEKARETRYQSAEELGEGLAALAGPGPAVEQGQGRAGLAKSEKAEARAGRGLARNSAFYAGAAVLLALAVYVGRNLMGDRKEALDSIAVLPFENVAQNPEVEAYCLGIADSVREKLSQMSRHSQNGSSRLKVISRPAAIGYKGKPIDPKTVGRELDIRALLTGTVSRSGDRLSIRAELVRTSDGSLIMEKTFERDTREIFDLEDVILATVLEGLGWTRDGRESPGVASRPIANITAYEYYLRAMALEYTHPDQGMKYLQNALEITGENAFLYAAMAEIESQAALFDVTRQDSLLAQSEGDANKALSLEPDLPLAHVVLGYIYSQFRGDQLKALGHFRKALTKDPDEPRALEGIVITDVAYLGRLEEGARLAKRLKAVDPQAWANTWAPGGLEFYAGRHRLALDPWRKMSALAPGASERYWYALALIYNERFDEAYQLIDRNASEFADSAFAKIGLVWKWALLRNKEEMARAFNSDLEKACLRDADLARCVGLAMAILGEDEKALDWLQIAVDRGFLNYSFIESDPFLGSLRDGERFRAIVAQAKREFEALPE